jgi:DNA repair protein RadC
MAAKEKGDPRMEYQRHLFGCTPIYTTRLVRERMFTYPDRHSVSTPAGVASVLEEYFRDRDREEFLAVLLDTANTIIGLSCLSVGGLAVSIVEPRQVFKVAILSNAAGLILAHCHPSGQPEPSKEDVSITKKLGEAGKLMGIPVLDHLIIHDHGYTSLAERGLMDRSK